MTKLVAIPLEQGRFFNNYQRRAALTANVAIPLEQGRFFNEISPEGYEFPFVAIPLEQGRFFNASLTPINKSKESRNPFGAGTVFQ